MSNVQPSNAIYFPEGAGYLLVKVLQTRCDNSEIESNVVLVKSLDDNKLYARKTVELTDCSATGIPNEIEFNLSFDLIPRVKDITKYVDSPWGDYYWTICTEFCNGGDLRGLLNIYCGDKTSAMPELLIWKFVADFCKILNFLNENKVEHKDIWPQNIFLRYSEENLDDCLPDFVLGDFGWAVPLTEANRTEDMGLFCCRLWEMCLGYPWDGRTCDVLKPSHLSVDLRAILNHLIISAEDEVLTLDFLMNTLLPFAEHRIGQLRYKGTVRRHLSRLAINSQSGIATTWPEKLESLVEDWQLVSVQQSPNESGKLSIQGLPRAVRKGERGFVSFHKSSTRPVDLSLVYRFDAGRSNFPPTEVKLNGESGKTTFMVSAKEDTDQKEVESHTGGRPMKTCYARKRQLETSCVSSASKRRKTDLFKVPIAKVFLKAAHPQQGQSDSLTNVEVDDEDDDEVAALREAIDLSEANLRHEAQIRSEADDLTVDEDDDLDEAVAENEVEMLAKLYGLTKEEKERLAKFKAQSEAERLSQAETLYEPITLSDTDGLSDTEASSNTEALSDVKVVPHTNLFHEAVTQAQIRLAKLNAGNSPEKKATSSPIMATGNLYKRAIAHAKKSPAGRPNGCLPSPEEDLPWLYMSKSDAIFLTASWLVIAICLVPQLF